MKEASYTDGAKWNNGFLIANVDSLYGFVDFEYVNVAPTMAVSGGNYFYRTEEEIYPAMRDEIESFNRGNIGS